MEIPKLFHPLLFSFFPTFYVYSQNIHVLIPTELLLPLLVISGGTIVGFFILEKIQKNKEETVFNVGNSGEQGAEYLLELKKSLES